MRLSRRLLALSRSCYRIAKDQRAVHNGETYRYRDGSVPFLRNIRNIGASGFLFGAQRTREIGGDALSEWRRKKSLGPTDCGIDRPKAKVLDWASETSVYVASPHMETTDA